MRKLVVSNIMSLDGYITGPGADVMAMPMDHAFDQSNAERMRAAGTLLLGATTYRGFLNFWPYALANPSLTEPSREIAKIYANGIEKVVVSDSLTPEDTGPWRDSTRIVPRADAAATVAELKASPSRTGDILVFGSATTWNALLMAGLVDELHLMVGPAVVGDGIPAFGPGVSLGGLVLREVRRWAGSSNVQLVYSLTNGVSTADEELLRRPIGWWLKEADARLDAAFDQVLAGHDVDRRGWQVLAALSRSPAPRTDVVVALTAFDEPAVVNHLIDGLRSRGWVDESDGVLRLTPSGLGKQQTLAPLVEHVRKHISQALPPDEYATLIRLIARVVAALPQPTV